MHNCKRHNETLKKISLFIKLAIALGAMVLLIYFNRLDGVDVQKSGRGVAIVGGCDCNLVADLCFGPAQVLRSVAHASQRDLIIYIIC